MDRDNMNERPIEAIVIGQRYRTSVGDLDTLVSSIAQVGLLHPIVITPNNVLIAGQRRLEACLRLGWDRVPVTVVPADIDMLTAQRDENAARLDLPISDQVALGRALEDSLKTPPGRPSKTVETFHGLPQGKTRDKVAAALGMSGRTYEKARAVVQAAEQDESFEDLVAKMDQAGKVTPGLRQPTKGDK